MRAYLSNLPNGVWALAAVPAVLLAYPIARVLIPFVVHAIVPDVVRNVLNMI